MLTNILRERLTHKQRADLQRAAQRLYDAAMRVEPDVDDLMEVEGVMHDIRQVIYQRKRKRK